MYKFIARNIVPTIFPPQDREIYNKIIRFCSVLFNPLTLFCVFLYLRTNDYVGSEDFHIPEDQRVSNITYLKMVSYYLFPNLTFYYWNHLSLWQVALHNWLGIPDCLVIMYYIYTCNVSFSGIKYLIWLIYKVSSIIGLVSYVVDFVTYDITALQAERAEDRRRLQNDIQTWEYFVQAFETTQLSRVVTGLDNIANMNSTQMLNHKAKLQNDIEEIEKRLNASTTKAINISNAYGATTDLKSETCVICLENTPVYQFVPCYHCCLCEDCVHEQQARLTSGTNDVAADEDDILSDEDYQFTSDVPFDSKYEDSNNFVKCETNMRPFGSFKQCPICKTPANGLVYNNMGIKPHVSTRNFDTNYHNEGKKRGQRETDKLIVYLSNNQNEIKKLKPSTKELFRKYAVKTLSVMKK